MAVEMAAAATSMTMEGAPVAGAGLQSRTAVVVYDGTSWSALCRELGIASDGPTAESAVLSLKAAIEEAQAVAAERGISPGSPVDNDALLEFLDTHQGRGPVKIQVFRV